MYCILSHMRALARYGDYRYSKSNSLKAIKGTAPTVLVICDQPQQYPSGPPPPPPQPQQQPWSPQLAAPPTSFPTAANPNPFGSLSQSFADLSFSSGPPLQHQPPPHQQPVRRDPTPEKCAPAAVAPLPTISSLTSSASSIATSSDPASKDASGSKITDPDLVRLTDMAIQHIMNIAGNATAGGPTPRFVAEALYLRAGLYASGSFPNYLQKDPRLSFKGYETAARAGYSPGWFKLGRDYESVGDLAKARECFDLGVFG
ncbi:hypothetical protein FRB90_006332 [Tulasnella sp. 427]|nr:hypothetical protein FRB90_006332 [Tulasnella sp. 427]